jgi:hypothetical protein
MKGFITDGGCDEEPRHLGSLGHACPTPSRHHTGSSEIDRFLSVPLTISHPIPCLTLILSIFSCLFILFISSHLKIPLSDNH